MKRALTLLIVCLLLLPSYFALADVLIEPRNNFYELNRGKCARMDRAFYVNGQNGWLSVQTEPASGEEVWKAQNGDVLFIICTYMRDGKPWGSADVRVGNEWLSGWVPMEQMVLKYDRQSFEGEHHDEFYAYEGDYAAVKAERYLVLWTWPGSGEGNRIQLNERGTETSLDWLEGPKIAYRDADGREWAFLSYWYGRRNMWFCIDDPANLEIPAFHAAPEPELIPAPAEWPPPDVPGVPGDGRGAPWLAIGLVAGAAMLTLVLIVAFWKPGK